MSGSVLAPVSEEKQPSDGGRGGGGGGGGDGGFGGGGNGGNPGGGYVPVDVSVTGIWIAIIAIVMLFAALTSVWVIRKGMSREWVPTALPGIIYVNSIILLISSLTLEFARGSLTSGLPRRFVAWLDITLALGVAFIIGQLVAWRDLVHHGVYLATDPSSSFFYLLTAAHGLHILGGIVALSIAVIHGPAIARGLRNRKLVDVTAIYWHFMYVLWIYILLLLVLKV